MKRWQEADGVHLDLRGLEPPEPMVAILSEIDGGGVARLTVHMDREPIFLFPELTERGWGWRRVDGDPVTLVLAPEAS